MTETLRGLPENVEAVFGESILARDAAIARLSHSPGVGPPDLAWLQKASKTSSSWGMARSPEAHPAGYYHWVLGPDVSSMAALAGYFAQLTALQEVGSMFAGLWGGTSVEVQRGFYCCYDPFTRTDGEKSLAWHWEVHTRRAACHGSVLMLGLAAKLSAYCTLSVSGRQQA